MKPLSIYIHIPFCLKKCLYCDFVSVVLSDDKLKKHYCRALLNDIIASAENLSGYKVESVYLGGGTPSLLEKEDIFEIIKKLRENFFMEVGTEITLEANPATLTDEKLSAFRQYGVNRVSLGVQSFNDNFLKILGRIYTSGDVFKTLELLKKNNIKNTSIDLMYGLPGQVLSDWEKDIDCFISLGLEHISFYDLKIEKGTPFNRLKNKLKLPDDDLQVEMYKSGCGKLRKAGYSHYEISSFAKPKMESRHNQNYWKNGEYLGLGAGAYSYLNGARFCKNKSVDGYIKESEEDSFKHYALEKLGKAKRLKETIALRLRILREFDIDAMVVGIDSVMAEEILTALQELKKDGLVVIDKRKCRLSEKGILFYDSVAGEILE